MDSHTLFILHTLYIPTQRVARCIPMRITYYDGFKRIIDRENSSPSSGILNNHNISEDFWDKIAPIFLLRPATRSGNTASLPVPSGLPSPAAVAAA